MMVRTATRPLFIVPEWLINPLLIAGHEGAYRERCTVDVRRALN